VNEWVRTSGAFDAVVDFDAAVRDPRDPRRFRPEADSPDLLHPGDAGYRLMAEAFDLSLFAARR
jgi:lysophospholipase L1-like esterase